MWNGTQLIVATRTPLTTPVVAARKSGQVRRLPQLSHKIRCERQVPAPNSISQRPDRGLRHPADLNPRRGQRQIKPPIPCGQLLIRRKTLRRRLQGKALVLTIPRATLNRALKAADRQRNPGPVPPSVAETTAVTTEIAARAGGTTNKHSIREPAVLSKRALKCAPFRFNSPAGSRAGDRALCRPRRSGGDDGQPGAGLCRERESVQTNQSNSVRHDYDRRVRHT
jgi:hypothetical protein